MEAKESRYWRDDVSDITLNTGYVVAVDHFNRIITLRPYAVGGAELFDEHYFLDCLYWDIGS
jgi:hypothetical protein